MNTQPHRTIVIHWTDGTTTEVAVFGARTWSETVRQFREQAIDASKNDAGEYVPSPYRSAFVYAIDRAINLRHVRMAEKGVGWENEP